MPAGCGRRTPTHGGSATAAAPACYQARGTFTPEEDAAEEPWKEETLQQRRGLHCSQPCKTRLPDPARAGTERAAAPGCPVSVGWLSKGEGKRGGSRMVAAHPSWSWQGGVTPSDPSRRRQGTQLCGAHGSWLSSAGLQEPSAALLADLCALWHQQKTQPGGSTPVQSCPLPKVGSLRPGRGFRGIPQVIPADG